MKHIELVTPVAFCDSTEGKNFLIFRTVSGNSRIPVHITTNRHARVLIQDTEIGPSSDQFIVFGFITELMATLISDHEGCEAVAGFSIGEVDEFSGVFCGVVS